MRSFLEDEDVLYADLPGKRASEKPSSIVPVSIHSSDICKTRHGPDQKYGNNTNRTNCPYDSRENLRNARASK